MTLFYVSAALAGYLIGSIPTGYWLGRFLYGVDVRQSGSGNLGATNVFRVLGWKTGLLTLLLDILKGYVPVEFVSFYLFSSRPQLSGMISAPGIDVFFNPPWWYLQDGLLPLLLVVGLSTILGHTFSCFVHFRGGKGVATSLGVFAALLPVPCMIALCVFLAVFGLTRFVSLGSLLGAFALAVSAFAVRAPRPIAWASVVIAVFVVWTHRTNILRLLNGTENRLSWHKKSA